MKKTFLKFISLLVAVLIFCSVLPPVLALNAASSGTARDGVFWNIDTLGTLTVSGKGSIVTDATSTPWYNYNESIFSVIIDEGITAIPSGAFSGIAATSIYISSTVNQIAADAFNNTANLQDITVSQNNNTYFSKNGILFSKDNSILIRYPENKSSYSSYVIPAGVNTIDAFAFYGVSKIDSLYIPSFVTAIRSGAFSFSNIKEITLSDTLKSIPNNCFSNCHNIQSVKIPNSVETVSSNAFYNSSISLITIGSGVKCIEAYAFGGCDKLSFVHYTGTNEQWNSIDITLGEYDLDILKAAPHFVNEDTIKKGFAAGCTTDGHTDGVFCNDCQMFITGSVIPAMGHNWKTDGTCVVCNAACPHNVGFDGNCTLCHLSIGVAETFENQTNNVNLINADSSVMVKFTATADGQYVIYSFNGNSEADPNVTLYDQDKNKISSNDDYLSGLDFNLVFTAVKGKTYYFKISDCLHASSFSYIIKKHIVFSHQPTAKEPYVALNWDFDTSFQWYQNIQSLTKISANNATVVTNQFGQSAYSEQNGWSGVIYDSEYTVGLDFFTVALKSGNVIELNFTGDILGAGIFDYDTNNDIWQDAQNTRSISLTATADGNFTVYAVKANTDDNIFVNASIIRYSAIKLNGQTKQTLQNPLIGSYYSCVATTPEGSFTSNIFKFSYHITKQPSAQSPQLTLNDNTNAKYQWFSVKSHELEITNKNAVPFSLAEANLVSTYDSINGWHAQNADGIGAYFTINLKSGDQLKIVSSIDKNIEFYLIDYSREDIIAASKQNDHYLITAPNDGNFILIAKSNAVYDTFIKVYSKTTVYEQLEGQTQSKLVVTSSGNFACLVTFCDNSTEMSEIISIQDDGMAGDVNRDNVVNNKDIGLLMRYLNNWDVKINTISADVNDDGIINNKDYGLLVRYINEWDVTIK